MNEPPRLLADSVLPQTLREAVSAFRSSRLRLRSLIPWASDATLILLTDDLTAHEKTSPSSDGCPPGAMPDPDTGPTPTPDLFQGTNAPPHDRDFPTAKVAIVWALGVRGQATAKEIGAVLAGFTVAGKPLSPFALSRLLVTHPDVVSAGQRQDPRHPKRSNAVYALRSRRPGVTLMTQPVRPADPEETPSDIFAKAQEVSETGFPPFAPTPKAAESTSLDPEAEAVRAATGLPLAPKGTHFSSPADLVRECLKIKTPADSPDLHAILTRRGWKFRGKTPDLKTLSTHLRTLVGASVLHVAGSNHRGVGRPYHLYALGSDKPAPDPTIEETPSVAQEGPASAPAAPSSAPSIGPTQSGLIRSILADVGPLTPGEIAEHAKTRTANPPSCGQISAQLLRNQGKMFRRLPDSGRWVVQGATFDPTITPPSITSDAA